MREEDRQRVVENPIVLWFNGIDHYEAIRFVCLQIRLSTL
jgi:hypothetical protein